MKEMELEEKLVADLMKEIAVKPSSIAEKSLTETARIIAAVTQPRQPSEEFMNKVSNAVQERFEEQQQISVEKIQRIIGMAVTSDDFRKDLFNDMVAACNDAGFSLTLREIAALRNLKEDAIEEFANSLDERVTKFFGANLP
jgi:hypothetical protein